MTVRSSGTRWISSITTVRFPGEPASLPKTFGTGAQAAVQRRIEKVQIQGVGKPAAQPGGLAGSARAEQEATLIRNLEKSTYNFHNGSKNGNRNSDFLPKYER